MRFFLIIIYLLISSTTTFAQTVPNITTSSFGAVCDGQTDDTFALDRFFNKINTEIKLGEKPIGIVEGMCKTNGNIIYPETGFTLKGKDASSGFYCTGSNGYCLDIVGGHEGWQKIPLVQSVYRGQNSVTVSDSSNLQIGDHIIINSYPKNTPNLLSQRQFNKVISKNGNVLGLQYPSTVTIVDLTNASVQKVTATKGVSLENLIFDGTGARVGLVGGLQVAAIENGTFKNLVARNFTSWYLLSSGVQQGATGLRISYCNNCSIVGLTAKNLNRPTSYPIYLYFLVSSRVDQLVAGGLNQKTSPLELVYSTHNTVSNVRNTSVTSHRLFKLYGSTGNTITDVYLVGNTKIFDKNPSTGLSISSGSAFNIFKNINVDGARTCIWLNGTENNNNQFDGLRLKNCVENISGVSYPGYAIATAQTSPFADRNNLFKNVTKEATAQVLLQGVNNTLSTSKAALNMTVCSHIWSQATVGANTHIWLSTDCSNGLPQSNWVSLGSGENSGNRGGEVSCTATATNYTASTTSDVLNAKATCVYVHPQEVDATFCTYKWSDLSNGWRSRNWQPIDCTNGLPQTGWVSIGQGVNGTLYGGQVGCYTNLGRHYTHPSDGSRTAEVKCLFLNPAKEGTVLCEHTWSDYLQGTRTVNWSTNQCKSGLPQNSSWSISQSQNGSGTVGQGKCSVTGGSHTNLYNITTGILKCLFVGN